jgi:hypothetical protein
MNILTTRRKNSFFFRQEKRIKKILWGPFDIYLSFCCCFLLTNFFAEKKNERNTRNFLLSDQQKVWMRDRDVRDQGFLVPVPVFFYIEVYYDCDFFKICTKYRPKITELMISYSFGFRFDPGAGPGPAHL